MGYPIKKIPNFFLSDVNLENILSQCPYILRKGCRLGGGKIGFDKGNGN